MAVYYLAKHKRLIQLTAYVIIIAGAFLSGDTFNTYQYVKVAVILASVAFIYGNRYLEARKPPKQRIKEIFKDKPEYKANPTRDDLLEYHSKLLLALRLRFPADLQYVQNTLKTPKEKTEASEPKTQKDQRKTTDDEINDERETPRNIDKQQTRTHLRAKEKTDKENAWNLLGLYETIGWMLETRDCIDRLTRPVKTIPKLRKRIEEYKSQIQAYASDNPEFMNKLREEFSEMTYQFDIHHDMFVQHFPPQLSEVNKTSFVHLYLNNLDAWKNIERAVKETGQWEQMPWLRDVKINYEAKEAELKKVYPELVNGFSRLGLGFAHKGYYTEKQQFMRWGYEIQQTFKDSMYPDL